MGERGPEPKYNEAKSVRISGRLTPRAAEYFESKGKWEWLERLARGEEAPPEDI